MGILSPVRRMFRPDHVIAARHEARMDYLRPRRAESTMRLLDYLWGVHVAPVFGHLLPEEVATDAVADWHGSLADTPVAANRALDRVLSALYTRLRKRGHYTGPNPCEDVERYQESARRRRMSPREQDSICSHLDGVESAGGARAVAALCIRFLMVTGVREGEAVGLAWNQVGEGFLELDTKTGYLMRFIDARAECLISAMPRIDKRVFPVSLSTVLRVWREAREASGCPDLTIHDLRRTYSSRLGDAGVSERDVAELMGQSTVTNIRHYRVMSAERKRQLAAMGGELMTDGETKRASSGCSR